MKSRTNFILMVVAICIAHPGAAQEMSPFLFGQNHWMEQNDERNRPGYLSILWPKVKESGIKTVRIGGGGYERRLPALPKLTGIIDSIQSIGAEPILQVPSHYSSKQASDLVNHFNKNPKRKPIKFWSIGNEPLLRVRHDSEAMLKKLEEVYVFIMRLAPALKTADPNIQVLIYDGAGMPIENTENLNYEAYEALVGGRLDVTGKDKNGNYFVDGINWHIYPNRGEYSRDHVIFSAIHSVKDATIKINDLIEKANTKHGRKGENKLKWGLTEVNVNAGNPDREISGIGCPSFLGGQFIAEVYGIGLEYGAYTVAPWCINETDRVRTDFGYLGLPMDFHPRSSYYHTKMMAQNMQGAFLPTSSSNAYVKTIATQSEQEICVMILNRDKFNDFEFDLTLKDEVFSKKPLIMEANVGLDVVITGNIPRQTTMMYVLSKSGEVIKHYTYGVDHNMKHLPPELK
ncbi:MAG: hypothetical protein JXQ96_01735 [Cyclobacteriaceae bacterium]